MGGFTYEWRRDGAAIPGETQATYDTGAADVGREIRVAVIHTDSVGNEAGAILSPSVSVLDDVSNNVVRPVFTSGVASSAPENAVATGYTAQADAAAGSVRYAITGGADRDLVAIDAASGVVSFVAAPDFEVPGDDGGDNVYAFAVTATATSADGSASETATQDVEVRVTNVDEPTGGRVVIANVSRAGEPAHEGDALRADTSAVTDGDGVGGFTYEWRRDGTPISGATQATYDTGAADVGREIRVAATHTDVAGHQAGAILSPSVSVLDDVSNNVARPVFTSGAASSAPENAVATGYAQANAAAGSVRYAITGGADAQRFEINASTGVVRFVAAPDFEVPGDDDGDNVYAFAVTATATSADGSARETATQDVEIRVTNVDEPTEGAVSIVNASRAGEPVREGDALRADTSAITDGDGVGGFTYEWRRDGTPVSGETGQTYTAMADDVGAPLSVAVVHTDAVGNEASAIVSVATAAVEDDVSNNVARPVFTSGAASSAPENAVATGYTAQADASAGSVRYAITGGADAQRFEINASTGVVSFVAAPDFEVPGDDDGDNVYAFEVTATATSVDGSARETATQDVEVRVTNVDEPTAGAVSIVNASRAGEAVREGDALRADTSAITDGDGVGGFTYEWRRDGTPIPGETQATYTAMADDVGAPLSVAVVHTDAAGNEASAIVSVATAAVEDDVSNNVARPVFTSGAASSAPENAVATGYRAQADAAAGSVRYAITGGADAQRFEINASTGVVSFVAAPDFEVPGDDDGDNVYAFAVTATATSADGSARETATQDVEIRVTNVDEPTAGAVSIVNASRAGEAVREGDALRADTSAITDGDGVGGFTYEWRRDGTPVSGETGQTYTAMADDVGAPLSVAVVHTDAVGNEASAIVSVATAAVEDDVSNNVARPVFTSGAASSAPENAVATGYTAQANAAAGSVSYAITGGADAQRFEINASTGVVSFVAAPDFEVPGDDDGDNVYAFAVTATATSADGSARETATQDVEVRVTNVDEPTEGAVSIVNASRAGEPVREGDALRADTSAITDGDGVGGFTYEWRRDGTPISGATQATYDTGAADVGREIRVAATHTDAAGHQAGAILSPSVSVLDDVSNNVARPVFTSGAASSAPENAVATGYRAQADAAAGSVSYAITGGADAQRFEINASTGVVSFVAAPDFEVPGDDDANNVYNFRVTATATSADGSARETATQDVEVRVTNVDEPTEGAVSIVNASRAGEPVREGDALRADTSAVTDGDGVGGFTYEWRRDGAAIPGETQATYDTGAADVGREIRVAVIHTDSVGNEAGAILSPSVSVLDDVSNNVVRPVFTSGVASSAPENAVATGYTAQADAAAGSVRYAITGGADRDLVAIDAASGVVSFVAAPDFEVPGDDGGDNVYAFAVTATARSADGSASETATQDVEVRVTNVDEPTGGRVVIANVSRAGEPAHEGDALRADTSAVTDGDGVGGFTYEWRRDGTPISGATQATYDTGAADVGREIRVAATHTDVAGHQAGAILSPSVSVLDDVSNNVARPVFTSGAAFSAPENAVATGYRAQADAAAGSVSYAITGGADAQRFEINASTGVVSFVAAPDFEVPGDDDANNVYNFRVTATATSADGSARETATQDVEVRVTNVDEPTEGAVSIVNASRAGEPVREGDALRADTSAITDGDGVGGFTYEWRRDGTPVSGETGQTYTAMADDVGAPLSVAVVHTDAVGNEASAIVSVATAAVEDDVSNNVARPVFTSGAASSAPENAVATGYTAQANAAAGSVRYAITGGADRDLVAIDAASGVVSFVAAPDFEVPGDDDGDNVYAFAVTATARSADGSASETATQDVEIRVTNVDEPTEGTVSIVNASRAGEPVREGDALRADTSAITDGDGVGGFTYEWRRDGTPVSGATQATYTAMADDVGAPLSVAVVHTDAVGNEASAIVSVATAAVEDDVANNVARPVFTSGAASSAPENAVATGYTAQANAAAGSVSYAITGGADAQRFEINASTGVVRFVAAPDFEVPGDDDGDNVYAFTVTATARSADGSASETATQDVEVRVTNVDEPTGGRVVIANVSRAGEPVREGDALRADTSAVTDGDGVGGFTYEWRRDGTPISGATQATYDTGAADVGREIRVAATHTDVAGHQAGAILSPSVSVLDDVSNNVARPVFTSGAAFSAPENAVATGYRAQADAAAGSVSYAITGGADAQRFEINASTGVVSFVAAPDFEVPGDDDANNVYNFRVTATATSADGSARETATQDVEVRVTNVDEPTEGAVSIVNASRAGEPVREGDALRADTSAITDGDGVGGFTYEWRRDGTPVSGETGQTYTAMADDVGAPLSVAVVHTDAVGNEASAIVSVATAAVEDDVSNNVARPVFTSGAASSAPENAVATGYTAQANAAAGSVRYAITGGADAQRFEINASTGVVSFVAAPDFEVPGDDDANNVYNFRVTATATSADGSARETATQDVEVRVTNVDEPTEGAVSIVNASRAGEPVREGDALRADTSAITDGDGVGGFTYEWRRDGTPISGATQATYDTGAADVGREIRVAVIHTDAVGNEASAIVSVATAAVEDDVANNVARPVFTSGAASSAPENAVATGYTAQANAAAGSVRYAITGGADAQRFEINASTGVVSFVAAPDFEVPGDDDGDNVYAFTVTATATSADGSASETATQDVEVRVTNVDEPTGGRVVIANVSRAGEPAHEGDALRADTSAVTDGDGVGGFTYEWRRDGTPISGATQATYDTGAADVGREIRVAATHTDVAGHQAGAILSPSVSVLDDVSNNVARPVFTSGAAFSAPENAVATGYTAQADAAAGSVSYAITGGADAQRFEINASTGVVSFVAAPDFEVPGDDDANNVYNFRVTATATSADGSARETATQDVEVRVTNVDEPTEGAVSIVNASRAGEPVREGDALRADTSAITDGDGVGGFTYEWRRDGTPVSGETGQTYTAMADDVGAPLSVAVVHTDAVGNEASAIVSVATAAVEDDVANNVARPVFTSGAASSAPENAVATGYTAQANAAAGSVRYAITGGADRDLFTIDAASGVVSFVAAPDFEVPGDDGGDNVYAFAVTATSADGSASETATQDVEVRVTNVDEPTEGAVSIVNASRAGEPVREGDALRADTSAITDGDGVGGFTYEWRRDGTPISGATQATYDTGAADVGREITVAATHTDAAGNEASAIVSVASAAVEAPANTLPTAEAGAERRVASGAQVRLDGGGSDANDAGQALSYAWTQTSGPAVVLSDDTVAAPVFTAPVLVAGAADAVLVFSLVVNDGVSDSTADTLRITVEAPANRATVSVIAPSGINTPEPFDVTIMFSRSVEGFAAGDIDVDNGQVTALENEEDGAVWTATITPDAVLAASGGSVAIRIEANAINGGNSAAEPVNVVWDVTRPAVEGINVPEFITSLDPFEVRIRFSEPVFLEPSGITVEGGAVTALRPGAVRPVDPEQTVANDPGGSDRRSAVWVAEITPDAEELADVDSRLTIRVAADVASDAVGNGNTAAPPVRMVYDATAPGVAIAGAPATVNSLAPFDVTVTFSEEVSGFAAGDVTVANGNAGNLRGSGAVYTIAITPDGAGDLEIGISGDVATDAAGNGNTAAASVRVAYDADAPAVAIDGAPATVNSQAPFDVTVTFSEEVNGFDADDVSVSNGAAGNLRGSGAVYRVAITPDGAGDLEICIAADVASDAVGNGNTAAETVTVDYAGITVSAATNSATTTEGGGTVAFTVVLDSRPTADVTIGVSSSDATEGTVDRAQLRFTAANWDQRQTVTVTGVDDDVADGDIAYTIRTAAAVSADGTYSGVDVDDVALTNTDDDSAGIRVSQSAVRVAEAAGTATYRVVLTSEPSADVTVTPSSSDETAAGVSGALRFTAANWATPQEVTVTGVDDAIDNDPDRSATVSHAVSGGGYGAVAAADVAVTVTDDDEAGIRVSAATNNATTTEGGGQVAFTVVLTSRPAAEVSIGVSSSDATEGTVDRAQLRFTAANWDQPQTVTVTGVDDDVADGDIAYTIRTAAAVSADATYSGTDVADVALTNTDDDSAGIRVSQSAVRVAEAAGTATYTLVLDSQPAGDVTITPTSSDPRAAAVSDPLTFTPQNWQTEQTMTVTGVNDDLDNPDDQRSARIRHAVSGGGYDEVQADDVSVTVIDDDTPGVTLSRQSVTVAEAGGTATYTLVLDSQPTGDVAVTLTSSDTDTATVSGPLTFTPQNWQTEQTVTVTGVNDDLDNPGDQRSARIRHAVSGGGYDGVQVADVAVTVSDDDDAPPRLAGLTISPQQVEEGSEPVMVTVTARLEYAVTTDTDVTVSVGGGESTATVGSDYKEVAPFVVRIPVGAASARGRFELIALDDRLDEAEETIRISARIDAGVASAAEAHMRLVDNDDPSAEIIAPALTRFGRTVGEQAVDAITARMVPNRALGFSGRIAGHDIRRCDPTPRKSDPARSDDAVSNAPAQNERIRPCDEAVSRGTDALQTLLSGADATLDRTDAGSLGLPGNGEASSPGRVQGLADMLAGTSFSYLSEIDSGARMGFWGKGVLSRFDGTHGETNLTGKVSGAMLGADWQMDDRLIGLMISRSHGDIDYRFNSNAAGKGSITADLTAFVPYASFRLADRLQGWFAPGYGLGSMTLKPQEGPENGPERQVPINWYMLAAGLREALVEPSEESGPGLDLTADFLHTQTSSGSLGASEALPALAATSGMTQRLRVGFDARWKGALPYGDFTPHLGVALRHDSGDADTGRGVEIGGGFRVSDPGLGLDLDLSGRTLALHEEGDFENWGLGLSLAWDPAPETKRGWSVRLRHDLGDVSGGQAALLAPSAFPALQETDRDTGRWSAEVAYGASLGQGLVGSPYTALSGNDASDRARLGYRIEVDARHAPDLSLDLWAEPEIRNDGGRAGVELRLRW